MSLHEEADRESILMGNGGASVTRLSVEKRRFPRMTFAASGLLVHRESFYHARLENISLTGALVVLQENDAPPIPRGGRCSLALYHQGGDALRFTTRVVHFGFDMACVKFVDMAENTRLQLRSILARNKA